MPGLAYDGSVMSHGGTIPATQTTVKADGKPVIRLGDPYSCPIHGGQTMVTSSATLKAVGALVCRIGDSSSCGATVTSGSSDVINNL
jgi:uncharacterized Zn-binding protein involved in type VI secretion